MADEKKIVTLAQLNTVKTYIDTKDGQAIKSGKFENNTIKLYTSTDKTGTAAITLNLPAEMYLDQTKTTVVDSFAWSDTAYPGSTNPSLDGNAVIVFAVTDGTNTTYSFASLASVAATLTGGSTGTATTSVSDGTVTAAVKISTTEGNTLTSDANGLYVAAPDTSVDISSESGNIIESKTDGIYASIDISTVAGNTLESKTDGLYVPTPTVTPAVSEKEGNAITTETDGLYVAAGAITYATDAEVTALFA